MGLPVSPLVLFHHLFQERIFGIAGTGYQEPDVLPVTIHQLQDTKGTQCTDPNWWPDLVPRWPPDSWRKGHCCLYIDASTSCCYVQVVRIIWACCVLLLISWRTLACRSVEWTTARSTSVHSEVRVWTLGRVDRHTVLAALLIGLATLCCIHSMAGYVHSVLRMLHGRIYTLCTQCALWTSFTLHVITYNLLIFWARWS